MKEVIVFNPSIEDGGVEKNLYIITNYLCSKSLKTSLISTDINKKNKFNKKLNFIYPKYIDYSSSGRYFKYLSCLIILFFKILISRKLIVLSFQANIYALIICKLFGIKIITRLNTAPQGWEHNKFKKDIYKYFIKKADFIIVNSEEFKKEVDKRYKVKSKFILNPFNFEKIKKLSKVKVKNYFGKNSLKLINVGRLTDQKDQITILKAIKNVISYRNIELHIIGKGELVDELKNYINNHNLKNKVKLLGYKTNPFPYILKSDIFILSSKFEGSPNVLPECQFLKKFIISTNCPTGTKEILKNGKLGKMFKVGDYKKLSEILKKINIKKKEKKIIQLAFEETKKYDYKLICEEYYKSVLKFI